VEDDQRGTWGRDDPSPRPIAGGTREVPACASQPESRP
jgi:hypothetical protein